MRLLCVLLLLHMFCLVLGDTSSPGHSSLQMHRVPRGSRHEAQKKRDQQPREPDTYFTTPRSLQSLNSTATSEHEAEMPTQPRGSPGLYNPLYPLSHASYSAYSITLLALMVFSVGVVGNLAVMCIVWHNQYMTNAWNCVLASVAFWDFLVLFFCLPVVVFHQLTQRRVLGDFSCRLVPYMEVTSLGVATFSLCALSIDRFHAATSTQPKVPRVERCHSILAKLAVVWLGSMLLAVPELLLWQLSGEAAADGLRDSCSMNPSRGLPESLYSLVLTYHDARTWWYFGCYFCLPVLFTILCQLATWRVGGASETECSSSSSVRQEQQERRLSHTVLALAVAYGICTLPENVCNMVQAYAPQPPSDSTLALLLLVNQFFLFLRCAATPVLLLCLCRSLGQAFLDCCCCCCEACVQDVSSTPAGSASASPTCQTKQKSASDLPSSIFFDKAKESSCILTLGASC